MALILSSFVARPDSRRATYVRFDGLRMETVPEQLGAGVWGIPIDRPVRVQIYAYADANARSAGATPIWSMPFEVTVAELGLIEPMPGSIFLIKGPVFRFRDDMPAKLHAALYRIIGKQYQAVENDWNVRERDFA